jgi:hypothetical protein
LGMKRGLQASTEQCTAQRWLHRLAIFMPRGASGGARGVL